MALTRILIVGLGSIGTRHARNFRALGVTEIHGMDPNPARGTQFCDEFEARVWQSLDEALVHGFDLAVIASPNSVHIEQAIQCADAGCHLLIEKPLGTSLDRVDELITVIRDRQRFAHVGSNWKFHRAMLNIKSCLDDGELGRLQAVQVFAGQWLPDWHPHEDYRNLYAARSALGGGIHFDTHEFDYLIWLFGPIAEMHGYLAQSNALDIETPDRLAAVLRFDSGVLGTFQADYLQRTPRREYRITGETGTLEWGIHTGELKIFRGCAQASCVDVAEDVNAMYLAQSQSVLEQIHVGGQPVTSVEHAQSALRAQLSLVPDHVG